MAIQCYLVHDPPDRAKRFFSNLKHCKFFCRLAKMYTHPAYVEIHMYTFLDILFIIKILIEEVPV